MLLASSSISGLALNRCDLANDILWFFRWGYNEVFELRRPIPQKDLLTKPKKICAVNHTEK